CNRVWRCLPSIDHRQTRAWRRRDAPLRARDRAGLCAELRRQIDHIGGYDVENARFGVICFARWAVFFGTVDEAGTQSETTSGGEVGGMCRAHHYFFRLQL